MNAEIWKDVVGYEGIYQCSNIGRIKSLDHKVYHSNYKYRIQKGRIISVSKSKKGYLQVSLSKNGKRFHTGVHRIMAISFIDNPENKPQVNHIDGNKENNLLSNLEWVTNSENQIHAINGGLCSHNRGENHHMSIFSNGQIKVMRLLFKLGVNNRKVAELYNCSDAVVSNIKLNKTYINHE